MGPESAFAEPNPLPIFSLLNRPSSVRIDADIGELSGVVALDLVHRPPHSICTASNGS